MHSYDLKFFRKLILFAINILYFCSDIKDKHYSFSIYWKSDDPIVINYCVLYAKQFIYLEKLKNNLEQNALNIDFWGYLSQFKYNLKIEKKHVFAEIKVLSSTSFILYMTT